MEGNITWQSQRAQIFAGDQQAGSMWRKHKELLQWTKLRHGTGWLGNLGNHFRLDRSGQLVYWWSGCLWTGLYTEKSLKVSRLLLPSVFCSWPRIPRPCCVGFCALVPYLSFWNSFQSYLVSPVISTHFKAQLQSLLVHANRKPVHSSRHPVQSSSYQGNIHFLSPNCFIRR